MWECRFGNTWVACMHQAKAQMDSCQDTAMKMYNLEQLELIRDPLTSTKCLVAWGQDTIVIAFRGTANRQNAAYDMKVHLNTYIDLVDLSQIGPAYFTCCPCSAAFHLVLKHSSLQEQAYQKQQCICLLSGTSVLIFCDVSCRCGIT